MRVVARQRHPQLDGGPLLREALEAVQVRHQHARVDLLEELLHQTKRKASLSAQRRSRVKLTAVVSPSPVGEAIVNDV